MSSIFHLWALKTFLSLVSSKGLKLTSYQVEPPSISFWWWFEFQIQYKALNFLQLRGGLKLQCVGWRCEESGGLSLLPLPSQAPALPLLELPFLVGSFHDYWQWTWEQVLLKWHLSNKLCIKWGSEVSKRVPKWTTPPWRPEAYLLGYHPQPGSLLGSTHRMWGRLSYRALARRLKSQAAFLLVTLDFHCNVRAFSSCTMQASPVMVLRVSCPTDVGSLFPDKGLKPTPLALKGRFLTTGSPEKSSKAQQTHVHWPWSPKNSHPCPTQFASLLSSSSPHSFS